MPKTGIGALGRFDDSGYSGYATSKFSDAMFALIQIMQGPIQNGIRGQIKKMVEIKHRKKTVEGMAFSCPHCDIAAERSCCQRTIIRLKSSA
jgi:hypothetical protein